MNERRRSNIKRWRSFAALVPLSLLLACGGGSRGDDGGNDTGTGGTGTAAGGGTGGGTGTGGGAVGLAALPNPPLTEAPSANDEPIADSQSFHTITDFAVVREGAERLPQPVVATFTEADFAAGLPDPEITVPAGVDPNSNGAPFFEGLQNTRVVAGEMLDLRFVPRDPEGELPGMFPQEIPDGASFVDNFDGTRSLQWQPLQADVGIIAFTAVAIDPAEPQYRTSQSVLIAIDAPSDPSSIPNVAPSIAEVDRYTVRQGDPVVILVEGVDRNGTRPTLELLDAPAGATLLQHQREEERDVLRFVSQTVGGLSIDILVTDAEDPNLTSIESIELDVLPPTQFVRSGSRLRDLAAARGMQIGFAAAPIFYRQPDGGIYGAIAAEEFNILTAEDSMKMERINPLPGRFEFADADNLVRYAQLNDMAVRGHTLVWHRQVPEWVESVPSSELEIHMREYITRMLGRYADDVDIWDVVNEPVAEDGGLRSSIWSDAIGEEYIDIAFRQARELAPDATLVLNEFDIGFAGPKVQGLLSLLDRLQARDVPVDAVGFQMHLFASYDQFDELADNFAAIAARGLDIHITELDVSLTADTGSQQQSEVYRRVFEVCLAQPRCNIIQMWGFSDRYSFRSIFDPLLFTRDFLPKPAYTAVQSALGG